MLLPVKLFTGVAVIGDQVLVLGFTLGTMFFSTKILRALWGGFFSDQPPWTIVLGVLVIGLSTPLPYTLARAAVYEAAILGGQFFLLAGLYVLFRQLLNEDDASGSMVGSAGPIGSRQTQAKRSVDSGPLGNLSVVIVGTCWCWRQGRE